jgi:hypothetical protein
VGGQSGRGAAFSRYDATDSSAISGGHYMIGSIAATAGGRTIR